MTLAAVMAFSVLLQALSVSLLLVASREAGRSAASARMLEVEVVWRSAGAVMTDTAQHVLATLRHGETRALTVPLSAPEWHAASRVLRAPIGDGGALRLSVVRRGADGRPLVARHGTIILRGASADTVTTVPVHAIPGS